MYSVARGRPIALIAGMAALVACGGSNGTSARVTIPSGASMRVAAESLHRAGVIESPKLFRLYAKVRGSDRGIKPGTYLLKKKSSWGSAVSALESGRGIINVVTIPEGFTLAQIEGVMVQKLGVPLDSVRAAMRDTSLLQKLDVPTPALEGYLFPDTYYFPPGTPARAVVAAMVKRFEQRWRPEWSARADTMKLSRHDLLTLASIVEREAKLPQERPVIAAVYWNRLRRGMLLQADPTVQYALPEYQTRLLNKHLNVQSRYNTYRYKGLPPGPIGAPGAASVQATLYPANVPYLYFVAHPDGHHEFRTKLEEHNAAVRVARRAWSQVRAQQAAATKTAPTKAIAPQSTAKSPAQKAPAKVAPTKTKSAAAARTAGSPQ